MYPGNSLENRLGARVRQFAEELSAGAAGAGRADRCRDQRSARVGVDGDGRGCPAARVGTAETVRKWVRQAEVDVRLTPEYHYRGIRWAEAAETRNRCVARGRDF